MKRHNSGMLSILSIIAALAAAGPVSLAWGSGNQTAADLPVTIEAAKNTITFRAVYRPAQFNRGNGLHNHHLVTWHKGKAAGESLFRALSPDSVIHDALIKIGAFAGNNLSAETWTRRNDPSSTEPDHYAKGSPLTMTIINNNSVWQLADVISDSKGNPFTLRFAGNRSLINQWQSGCVVCLQSCPGSKIANSTYTIRDLIKKKALFEVRSVKGLKDGDTVLVRISAEERK